MESRRALGSVAHGPLWESVRGRALIAASLLIVAVPERADAYLDPGTGSMILQVVLAAIAGALVTLKMYWTRIKERFAGRSRDELPEHGDE